MTPPLPSPLPPYPGSVHSYIPVSTFFRRSQSHFTSSPVNTYSVLLPVYTVGMSLAQTLSNPQSNPSWLLDWSIPHKYYTLVYQSNPHWPWSLPLPHPPHPRDDDNNNTNTTTKGISAHLDSDSPTRIHQERIGTAQEIPPLSPLHDHQPNMTNLGNHLLSRKKIGFFSSYFYRHPVGRLLGEVIARLAADTYVDITNSLTTTNLSY